MTTLLLAAFLQAAAPTPPSPLPPATAEQTNFGIWYTPPASAVPVGRTAETPTGPIYDGRRGQVKVEPPRSNAEITIDGQLNEPVWQTAALLTGFSQFFPNDGVAAQDSTEVMVWYSGTALHIGVRAYAAAGTVRATLADRDRITQDDNIQFFLGTYNDSRQAMVFAVNPFGIQSDGVLTETGASTSGGFASSTARARENADLAPDYVWRSRGRLTETGYEIEIAIPFKSLRYRAGDVQTWQLNVVRTVQATGHEQTWTQTRRASASFLAQSGHLSGLRELQRGLTLDLIPTITSSSVGGPGATPDSWRYDTSRPDIGGSARWGITSNLTLSGTANPDFSQVEADATQFSVDPRVAVYFPERRPFFLESQEQFTTPNRLIYTRRISQPAFATKLTGKHQGFDIGVLSAVDSRDVSFDGKTSPMYNILRLQRDVGKQSRLGVVYTDRNEGDAYNRVVGLDGRLVRGVYSVQGQVARSFTGNNETSAAAPLWDFSAVRNGRAFYARYILNGISEGFDAQSGFIARAGVSNLSATHRWNFFGKPGALVEVFSPEVFTFGRYRYVDFVNRRPAQDVQLHLRTNTRLKGGWQVGAQFLREEFGYDRGLYANYRLLEPRAGGGIDTVAYRGTPRLPNYDWVVSVGTPEFRRFSLSSVFVWGQDENFQEWSSANILVINQTLALRPTEQLRIAGTWAYEQFDRKTDGTTVLLRNTPRIRAEYQLTRQIFIRVIGEHSKVKQDSLRDDSRTERPVYLAQSNGTLVRATAFDRTRARLDVLFSYLPTPGTVVYLGYGDALRADTPGGSRHLRRSNDVFFAKLSYLYRLQ
ncbi:MAG: carbohydrate binding family 9 domain-containing protein [Gemmatimonadaceae bacterium]|nr:carbohydrate binding family 9 domain-containing protein [Gemmatimonadaceae bacterium]